MATIDTFKSLSGCGDNTVATYYVNKAHKAIKRYTKRNDVYIQDNLEESVIDLALCYYNQKGAEGIESQSYSGVSEHYEKGIPKSIRDDLASCRYFKQETEVSES